MSKQSSKWILTFYVTNDEMERDNLSHYSSFLNDDRYCMYNGSSRLHDVHSHLCDATSHLGDVSSHLWFACKEEDLSKTLHKLYPKGLPSELEVPYPDVGGDLGYVMKKVLLEGEYLVFLRNDRQVSAFIVETITDELKEHLTNISERTSTKFDRPIPYVGGNSRYSTIYRWDGEVVFQPVVRERAESFCESCRGKSSHDYRGCLVDTSYQWICNNYNPGYIENHEMLKDSGMDLEVKEFLSLRNDLTISIANSNITPTTEVCSERFGKCTMFARDENLNHTWREPNGFAELSLSVVGKKLSLIIKKLNEDDHYNRVLLIVVHDVGSGDKTAYYHKKRYQVPVGSGMVYKATMSDLPNMNTLWIYYGP